MNITPFSTHKKLIYKHFGEYGVCLPHNPEINYAQKNLFDMLLSLGDKNQNIYGKGEWIEYAETTHGMSGTFYVVSIPIKYLAKCLGRNRKQISKDLTVLKNKKLLHIEVNKFTKNTIYIKGGEGELLQESTHLDKIHTFFGFCGLSIKKIMSLTSITERDKCYYHMLLNKYWRVGKWGIVDEHSVGFMVTRSLRDLAKDFKIKNFHCIQNMNSKLALLGLLSIENTKILQANNIIVMPKNMWSF